MNDNKSKDLYRSYQSKVEGLGSAHSGFHHWWMHKITSVALIPLSVWFAYNLITLSKSGYSDTLEWISSPVGSIGMILFLFVFGYHNYLVTQVVFEDYIHNYYFRMICRIGLLFFTIIAFAIGTFLILSQPL